MGARALAKGAGEVRVERGLLLCEAWLTLESMGFQWRTEVHLDHGHLSGLLKLLRRLVVEDRSALVEILLTSSIRVASGRVTNVISEAVHSRGSTVLLLGLELLEAGLRGHEAGSLRCEASGVVVGQGGVVVDATGHEHVDIR